MKMKYETPSVEILRFDYTEIVTESPTPEITETIHSGCESSPIDTPAGWTEHHSNPDCEHLKPTNKQNWNKCNS